MDQVSRRLVKLGIHSEELGHNDENAPSKAAFFKRLEQLKLREDLTRRPAATSARECVPPVPSSRRLE